MPVSAAGGDLRLYRGARALASVQHRNFRLLRLIVVMLVALLIVPFTTLSPIFARDILSVGAAGQGLLLTAMGVGALSSIWHRESCG